MDPETLASRSIQVLQDLPWSLAESPVAHSNPAIRNSPVISTYFLRFSSSCFNDYVAIRFGC